MQHVDSSTAKRKQDETAEQGRERRGSVDSSLDSLFGGSDDDAILLGNEAPEEEPQAEAQQSTRESQARSPGRQTEPAQRAVQARETTQRLDADARR